MKLRFRHSTLALGVCVVAILPAIVTAQDRERPAGINGHPNLSGIWQALGTARRDLAAHPARLTCPAAAIAEHTAQELPGGQLLQY